MRLSSTKWSSGEADLTRTMSIFDEISKKVIWISKKKTKHFGIN